MLCDVFIYSITLRMKKISRIKYTLIFVFIMPFMINAQSAKRSFKSKHPVKPVL